ncbi:hypothetical protein MTO96_042281 [Rhipicephalus appendiculatus]
MLGVEASYISLGDRSSELLTNHYNVPRRQGHVFFWANGLGSQASWAAGTETSKACVPSWATGPGSQGELAALLSHGGEQPCCCGSHHGP